MALRLAVGPLVGHNTVDVGHNIAVLGPQQEGVGQQQQQQQQKLVLALEGQEEGVRSILVEGELVPNWGVEVHNSFVVDQGEEEERLAKVGGLLHREQEEEERLLHRFAKVGEDSLLLHRFARVGEQQESVPREQGQKELLCLQPLLSLKVAEP